MDLHKSAQALKDYIVGLRRELHRHPEPSMEEYWTADRIAQELDALGIPHIRVGETGLIGTIAGSGGKVIALRADIDALRIQDEKQTAYASAQAGVMHACGHDAHTASLLGAARIIQENREAFPGTIKLLFQQGEEFGQGARVFIAQGCLEGVDRLFGIHVASDVQTGKVALYEGVSQASCDYFKIEIAGKAAHVSVPEQGTDALYIASQTVCAVQAVVARETSPLCPAVVGIGTLHAGTIYNAVADHAVMEGTTRAFSPQVREKINRRVTEIAQATAAQFGAKAQVHWEYFAAPLINDKAASQTAAKYLERVYGAESIVTDRPPAMGADDFADLAQKVPGTYAIVGTGNAAKPGTTLPHHCGLFDIDEDALVIAADLYAGYAYTYLNE